MSKSFRGWTVEPINWSAGFLAGALILYSVSAGQLRVGIDRRRGQGLLDALGTIGFYWGPKRITFYLAKNVIYLRFVEKGCKYVK